MCHVPMQIRSSKPEIRDKLKAPNDEHSIAVPMVLRRAGLMILALTSSVWLAGCGGPHTHDHARDRYAMVYYIDGAGAGGLLGWGDEVRAGLKQAGYRGGFEDFAWQTQLGFSADQLATVDYKRDKGRELAARIRAYRDTHPGRPVHLIGLSAGTAIAAFALEALPPGQQVDTVVMLGSSLASDYDLTRALAHVGDRMYVFASEKDAVLNVVAPVLGSADRQYDGARFAGLRGFEPPARRTAATRRAYAKVTTMSWRPSFARSGNDGGHTDWVKPRFIRDHVAPLLIGRHAMNALAGRHQGMS